MRSFAVFVSILASVCAGSVSPRGPEWNSLQVTYGKDGAGYYQLPWSVKEATAQNKWVKIDDDKSKNVEVYSQPDDPRLMILFDKKGTIAGIRSAYLKEDVQKKAKTGGHKFAFDYDNNPMYEKGNYFGKDLWHITVLFTSPKKLASGGRNPLNKETQEVAEALYFKGDDGKWIEISRDECKLNKDFVEGNCYPGMGKHSFYKLDENQDCAHRQPFFVLFNNGRAVGFGLSGYGSFTPNPKTQSYYEDFSIQGARTVIARRPKCVEEYIDKFGLTMMHVFLTKDASKVTCPDKDWKSEHC